MSLVPQSLRTTRRTFITSSLAAVLLPSHAALAQRTEDTRISADVVCVDDRLAHADTIMAAATASGRHMIVVHDDVEQLWRTELAPRIVGGPAVVIGVTSGFSALTIGELARDFGHDIVASRRSSADDGVTGADNVLGLTETLERFDLAVPAAVDWRLAPAGVRYRRG